ncbi:Proteasomal ATPase-associated factor 1 [Linnemannia exigua]|uniref:Proteasomal ATPase-associated factor 1 n=1 Tax=Linnemannia exigua TaxID=604196 RepID=A0AAD4D9V4_9FUNG|nr:Proteasomal ATPase-associated factor 1 [Linnemannia exigua]
MGIEGSTPTALVQVTVQADWTDVVADALRLNSTGTFWVSCYKRGSPSIHGAAKVSVVGDHKVQLTGHDGIVLEAITNYSFKVKIPDFDNIEVEVYGTGRRSNISKISCMDVSPQGALFVAGSEDGTLRIGETESGRITQELKAHIQYVNSCRFFPSGQAISDTAIIDRGRNVISSSNDGTVKLWEVASGETIRTLAQHEERMNAIALDTWESTVESNVALDPRDVGTEGKLVIAASEGGTLYGLDVRASEEAFQRKSYNKAPVRSCAYSAQHSLVVSGTSEGVVELFDIRKTDQVLNRFQRGTAGISSIVFSSSSSSSSGQNGPGLIIGCDDSGIYETKPIRGETSVEILREYVGYDLDGPARARVVGGGPALVAISKEGGLLRFSGSLGGGGSGTVASV